MLKKIGFTLLGFMSFAVAALLAFGLLCALGYLGLMIPSLELPADQPLYVTGGAFALLLVMLACVAAIMMMIGYGVGWVAFRSGHYFADQFMLLLQKLLQPPKQKTIRPTKKG
jgi:hypothetical protein